MDLLLPFKQALNNPVGDILLFLLTAIFVLLCFCAYFWIRFARHKDLTRCHYKTFKKTEKKLKNIQFMGLAISDLLGKKQVVKLDDGSYGRCLIFYPDLSTSPMIKRFEEFHLLLKRSKHSFFPSNVVTQENGQLIHVETQFLTSGGETLINFAQHHMDRKLSDAEKEHFLIDLAHMLEALHELKTEEGQSLYHGFLLPTSFYFSINIVQKITHVYLADYGSVFALGSDTFQKWLNAFFQNRYAVDSEVKKQLFEYSFIFSPEQKDPQQEITAATDFYSYAALAVYVFTERAFETVNDIDWETVPKRWHVFLKECLSLDPQDRPIHFMQLKEYFNEPDLMIETKNDPIKLQKASKTTSNSISHYFKQASKLQDQNLITVPEWPLGLKAIQEQQWEKALAIFNELMPEHTFEAHLGLAVLSYSQGNTDQAQKHYLEAKKIDAKRSQYFHTLIAFGI